MEEEISEYCLSWNDHHHNFLENFESLLNSGNFSDCTLSAEGNYLNVHKIVLSGCSLYFKKLLDEHYEKHPIIILSNVTFDELKSVVEYMYKGKTIIHESKIADFIKITEFLQLKGLSKSKFDKDDVKYQKNFNKRKRKTPDSFAENNDLINFQTEITNLHQESSKSNENKGKKSQKESTTASSSKELKLENPLENSVYDTNPLALEFVDVSEEFINDISNEDNSFIVNAEALKISSENQKRDTRYKPTKKKVFERRKRVMNVAEKLRILNLLKSGNRIIDIAKEYDVNESTIRSIRSNKEKIYESVSKLGLNAKYSKVTRLSSIEEVESMLITWLQSFIDNKIPIAPAAIRKQALKYHQIVNERNKTNEKFCASNGWFQGFKSKFLPGGLILKNETLTNDYSLEMLEN